MEEKINEFWNLGKGIIISFAVTIILFYLLGIILSCTSISENIITPAVIVITGISILIGTSIVTIKSKKRGMIKGSIVGATYFGIIYLISSILLNNFEINVYSIIMLFVAFLCGGIGGVVGVNIKN